MDEKHWIHHNYNKKEWKSLSLLPMEQAATLGFQILKFKCPHIPESDHSQAIPLLGASSIHNTFWSSLLPRREPSQFSCLAPRADSLIDIHLLDQTLLYLQPCSRCALQLIPSETGQSVEFPRLYKAHWKQSSFILISARNTQIEAKWEQHEYGALCWSLPFLNVL